MYIQPLTAANHIYIQPMTALHQQEYYNLTWRLCIPGRINNGTRNYQEDAATWYSFSFEHLCKSALPDPMHEGFMTFFVGKLI
jgi:hypothetical protein